MMFNGLIQSTSEPLQVKDASSLATLKKFYESKQFKKALKLIDQLISQYNTIGGLYSLKALILLDLKDKLTEATEVANKALNYDVKNHYCWYVLGSVFKQSRNLAKAKSCFSACVKLGASVPALEELAYLQLNFFEFQAFRESYRQIFNNFPLLKLNWLAYALSQHLVGDCKKAGLLIVRMLELFHFENLKKNNIKPLINIYEYLVLLFESQKEYDLTVQQILQIPVEIRSQYLWKTMARIAMYQKNYSLAHEIYKTLYSINIYDRQAMVCSVLTSPVFQNSLELVTFEEKPTQNSQLFLISPYALSHSDYNRNESDGWLSHPPHLYFQRYPEFKYSSKSYSVYQRIFYKTRDFTEKESDDLLQYISNELTEKTTNYLMLSFGIYLLEDNISPLYLFLRLLFSKLGSGAFYIIKWIKESIKTKPKLGKLILDIVSKIGAHLNTSKDKSVASIINICKEYLPIAYVEKLVPLIEKMLNKPSIFIVDEIKFTCIQLLYYLNMRSPLLEYTKKFADENFINVDVLLLSAKVFHRCGLFLEAKKYSHMAMQEKNDLNIGSQWLKYTLEANEADESVRNFAELAGKRTREQFFEYQIMEYELRMGDAQMRLCNYELAVFYYNKIQEQLQTICDGFSDFHVYNIRNFKLRIEYENIKMLERSCNHKYNYLTNARLYECSKHCSLISEAKVKEIVEKLSNKVPLWIKSHQIAFEYYKKQEQPFLMIQALYRLFKIARFGIIDLDLFPYLTFFLLRYYQSTYYPKPVQTVLDGVIDKMFDEAAFKIEKSNPVTSLWTKMMMYSQNTEEGFYTLKQLLIFENMLKEDGQDVSLIQELFTAIENKLQFTTNCHIKIIQNLYYLKAHSKLSQPITNLLQTHYNEALKTFETMHCIPVPV